MNLRSVSVATQSGLQMRWRDPLRFRRLSSPQVRDLIEHVVQGIEGYGHAGNGAAKTEEFAALFVRMCRGQRVFDGRLMGRDGDPSAPAETDPHPIYLPGFVNNDPWRHWVTVQSYAQAKDSSMRAYRKVLGRWPHKIGWIDKNLGHVKLIKVKPEIEGWSDDPDTWSEITFISQENMTEEDVKYVQGARVNSVHGDEMQKQSVWQEIRARRIANERLYKVITATPEYKHEWEWCYADFLACREVVVRGRYRVQWSVDDNRALSLEDIALRKQDYLKGDGEKGELYDARVAGEHVDVSGANPFPTKRIKERMKDCAPGRLETIVIRPEPKELWEPDYRDILPASLQIERWEMPVADHSYLITIDPSRGIDDDEHDPCELQVWDWTEPMLVCRYGMRSGKGGYADEDSVGILAEVVGKQYNKALIDWEVVNGRGEQISLTLRKLRYPNLARDDRSVTPGTISENYGWNANPTTNGEIVNAIIKGTNDDGYLCFSADVYRQLLDVREDNQGRPANVRKGARHHREAMICMGRALHLIQTKAAPRIMQSREQQGMRAILRREFGRPVKIGDGGASRVRMPEVFADRTY